MQTIYDVGSASDAMRGKRLLEKQGVRAYIRKSNAHREYGCGYELLVYPTHTDAVSILRNGGVTVLRVRERDAL